VPVGRSVGEGVGDARAGARIPRPLWEDRSYRRTSFRQYGHIGVMPKRTCTHGRMMVTRHVRQ
jgi:hypothetical protein